VDNFEKSHFPSGQLLEVISFTDDDIKLFSKISSNMIYFCNFHAKSVSKINKIHPQQASIMMVMELGIGNGSVKFITW
jgi:hypothetical protein